VTERLAWLRSRVAKLGYLGGESTYTRADWSTLSYTPDQLLETDLGNLRARSRDLVRNSALAAGLMATYVDNVVGPGFSCVPSPRAAVLGLDESVVEAFRAAAEDAWEDWGSFADVAERTDWAGLQRMIEWSALEGGDVLVHFTRRDKRAAYWQLGVELVEAERIRSSAYDPDWTMGVLLGTGGQHVAFKVWPGFTAFVGEPVIVRRWDRDGQVSELYHFQGRPGQTRGIPLLTPILPLFRDLDDYLEAEVVAAVQAACISSVVKTTNPAVAASGRLSETSEDGNRIEEFRPGQIEYLAQGEELQTYNPQRPGNTFDPFVMRLTRMICRGIGLPYELGALDFSQTNYSSARAALIEVRRTFQARQRHFTTRINQPVYQMVIREAREKGRFDMIPDEVWAANEYELYRADWVAPGWGWVDPKAEVEAAVLAIENGLSTREIEARRATGRSWRNHLLGEIKAERKEMLGMGVVDVGQKPTA
jgi:lambda family phage portal protein